MASSSPTVLILGHSFVRRLSSDLGSNFDARATKHFNPLGDAVIHLHGVGGPTVKKLRLYDLGVVSALKPDVIILEIGTNDLGANRPEVVGSGIVDLVQLLLQSYSVRVIGILRGDTSCSSAVLQHGGHDPQPVSHRCSTALSRRFFLAP